MKKQIIIILFTLGLVSGAMAQRGGHSGSSHFSGSHYVRPRVTVIAPYVPVYLRYGLGFGYGYGFSPFYSPYNDPFYYQRTESTPSQLQLQLEDIDNEYDFKISSARHDKTLSRADRKQKLRELKHERENAVIDAKKAYYNRKDEKSSN